MACVVRQRESRAQHSLEWMAGVTPRGPPGVMVTAPGTTGGTGVTGDDQVGRKGRELEGG